MTLPFIVRSPEQTRRVERFAARQQRQKRLSKRRSRLALMLLGMVIVFRYYFMSPPSLTKLKKREEFKESTAKQQQQREEDLLANTDDIDSRNSDSDSKKADNTEKSISTTRNKGRPLQNNHKPAPIHVSPAQAKQMLESQTKFHQQARQEQIEFCKQWEARLEAPDPDKLPPLVPSALEELSSLFHEDQTYWMEVYPENDIVSNAVLESGAWEKEKTLRMAQWLQEYAKQHNVPLSNVTFVDIGANVGWYTFAMADLGVHVIAIEPLPGNVELMRRSLCRNPQFAQRITIHPVGLSSLPNRTCVLYSGQINVGDGVLHCSSNHDHDMKDNNNNNDGTRDDAIAAAAATTTTAHSQNEEAIHENYKSRPDYALRARNIAAHMLDFVIGSTLPVHQHIGALKMDTEGDEVHVVMGGVILFGSGRIPHIQSEYSLSMIQNKGGNHQELFHTLYQAGYQVRRDAVDKETGNSEPFLSQTQASNETGPLVGLNDILFEIQ